MMNNQFMNLQVLEARDFFSIYSSDRPSPIRKHLQPIFCDVYHE